MTLLSRQIAALYDGVSQQPATIRLPSQCENQVNAWSTVVQGVMKRPPTQHVAALSGAGSSAYIHIANRSTAERYIMVFTNGAIQVFDLQGNAKSVTLAPNGSTYLGIGSADPNQCFVAVTVGDTTFVLNKTKTVALKSSAETVAAVDISGQGVNTTMSTSDGIPFKLYGANPSGLLTGAPKSQVSYDPSAPNISVYQSFDALPGIMANTDFPDDNTIYTISGDSDNAFATYYVLYSGGAYDETVNPAGSHFLDPLTMPWALTRAADGTFKFNPIAWAPRRVGDVQINPPPSFVGDTLSDLVFYQNRLGLVHGEGVVFSQAGYADNFFRLTVTQTLADQLIDVSASDNEVTDFNFAVPFSTGVMFFSDQTQFRLLQPSDGELTSTTCGLNVATRFYASTTVRPQMIGADVYFVSEDDAYAHIREYYVTLNYLGQYQTDATDISAHIPSYIPKGVYVLSASLIHDALFVCTSAYPSRIYVYKFQYGSDQNNKTQECWGYWEMTDKVVQVAALDDYLYLLIYRGGTLFLEKMSLAIGANVGITDSRGNAFDLLMDRRVDIFGNSDGTGNTIYTFPYPLTSVSGIQMCSSITGAMVDMTGATITGGNAVKIKGAPVGTFYAGTKYTFTYEFSEQFQVNSNNVAILSGRLTLRNWWLYYSTAAVFSVDVKPYGNAVSESSITYVPDLSSAYDALTIGESASVMGTPVFRQGEFQFGVFGQSNEAVITVTNDTPYPSIFYSAQWEGDFTDRSRSA